jgi:hypothetical protein
LICYHHSTGTDICEIFTDDAIKTFLAGKGEKKEKVFGAVDEKEKDGKKSQKKREKKTQSKKDKEELDRV